MDLPEIPRLPGESKESHQALVIYLRMGIDRSATKVARELSKSSALIRRWSKRHGWGRRAMLYDAAIEESERRELSRLRTLAMKMTVRRRLEVRNNDWVAAQALRARAKELESMPVHRVKNVRYIEVTQEMVDKKETIVQEIHMIPAGWRQRDIASLSDIASKLERLATDLPTESIEIQTDSPAEKAAKALELARLALHEIATKFPQVDRAEIADRIGKRYDVEPAEILKAETVN